MKAPAKGIFINRIMVMITALFLMGTVPSFGATDDWTGDRNNIHVLPAVKVDPNEVPKLNGTSAILMDMGSGSILYEKNADKVREPASMTKILTCLIILEEMDLDEVVTIREGVETIGSIVGLIPGEKVTIEQLLYGMMLVSGNDAAEELAYACDGNIEDFADRMNERAKDCGATNSNFKNPNGLDEVKNRINYSTARDMVKIATEAMENEKFREIVSTAKYTLPATNKSEARKLVNTNYCLWDKDTKVTIGGKKVPMKYDGCMGIKTGLTDGAGYCFIGAAKRGQTGFMAISMNTDSDLDRFIDVMKLWDFAFDRFDTYKVISAGEKAGVQRITHGSVRKVSVSTHGDMTVTVNKDDMSDPGITTEFLLDKEKLEAPVEKDTVVGSVIALDPNGRLVASRPIYTDEAVPVGGPLSRIGIEDREAPWIYAGAALLILIILILIIRNKIRRKRAKTQSVEEMRSQLVKMRTAGEGMTPMEWSELTGDPREVPMDKGPSRLTESEIADLYVPETTRTPKPKEQPDATAEEDPFKPRRHGRMSSEEIEQLMSGRLTGDNKK